MKQLTVTENQRFFGTRRAGMDAGNLNATVILDNAKRYISSLCLDVGAGEGNLVLRFIERYPKKQIIGMDISPRRQIIIKGDCTNIDFTAETFGTVFCTDVIEHLADSDLEKCITEIHRVMRSGGYGVFSTNNKEDFSHSIVTCPECGCEFHRVGHCQQFSAERIKSLFEKHGFRIVKIKLTNLGFLYTLGWLARLFYFFRLEKRIKVYQFVSDIFFVVQKI